ncbi:hypothetical protein OS493_014638 [Desmophyllum pertusum]|uniref:Uncharacterized protein n=1 Tax=Desmophyllum pertusum TaxID=174260 RepID=A0A9W9YCV5_9CNID|nr:hypothetical protein OS493_014638 [Desmophyllum pertusum]
MMEKILLLAFLGVLLGISLQGVEMRRIPYLNWPWDERLPSQWKKRVTTNAQQNNIYGDFRSYGPSTLEEDENQQPLHLHQPPAPSWIDTLPRPGKRNSMLHHPE